jgi:hypothetical protein
VARRFGSTSTRIHSTLKEVLVKIKALAAAVATVALSLSAQANTWDAPHLLTLFKDTVVTDMGSFPGYINAPEDFHFTSDNDGQWSKSFYFDYQPNHPYNAGEFYLTALVPDGVLANNTMATWPGPFTSVAPAGGPGYQNSMVVGFGECLNNDCTSQRSFILNDFTAITGWGNAGGLDSITVSPNYYLASGAYFFTVAGTTIDGNMKSTVSPEVTIFPAEVAAVPEPSTYALMLAGLGVVGFLARRRKQGVGALAAAA